MAVFIFQSKWLKPGIEKFQIREGTIDKKISLKRSHLMHLREVKIFVSPEKETKESKMRMMN